jgi:hypothetical protein
MGMGTLRAHLLTRIAQIVSHFLIQMKYDRFLRFLWKFKIQVKARSVEPRPRVASLSSITFTNRIEKEWAILIANSTWLPVFYPSLRSGNRKVSPISISTLHTLHMVSMCTAQLDSKLQFIIIIYNYARAEWLPVWQEQDTYNIKYEFQFPSTATTTLLLLTPRSSWQAHNFSKHSSSVSASLSPEFRMKYNTLMLWIIYVAMPWTRVRYNYLPLTEQQTVKITMIVDEDNRIAPLLTSYCTLTSMEKSIGDLWIKWNA